LTAAIQQAAAPNGSDVNGVVSTSDLVKALNHRERRAILRSLLITAPASSKEIRRGTPGLQGNRMSFHFETLIATGAVVRGPRLDGYRESLYSPTEAVRAQWCRTVLKLTAEED
jgi:hypothetical protein